MILCLFHQDNLNLFMAKTSLRWAKVSDAQAIASLELSSAIYEHRRQALDFTVAEFTEIWQERIRSYQYQTILCEREGIILGFLSFYRQVKRGEICCLYIDPKYFRQGIGRRLIRAASLLVSKLQGKSLKVEVEVLNFGAQAFYKELHFRALGVKLSHLIEMKKEL